MRSRLTGRARGDRQWLRGLTLALLVVALGGCNGSDPITRKQAEAVPKEKPTAPPASSTDDLIVYLDTSSSMKGYVQADGRSVFSKTLRHLRAFTAVMSPPIKVQLRTVDSVVGPLLSNVELSNASTSQDFYRGTETNLVGAFVSFAESLQAASPPALHAPAAQKGAAFQAVVAQPSPQPAAPPQPPARFHVLITDGVQYAKKQNAATDCAAGADQYCVQKKIFELLRQGWGGAVIGLRSQFCCAIFSEQSQRPVPYNTKGRDRQEYRPFYLYVFSPDREALSQFVTRFKESLRRAVGEQELVLRELALTALYAEGEMAGHFRRDDFETENKEALRAARVDDKEPLYISLKLRAGGQVTEVPFTLKLKVPWTAHALDSGSAKELADLLQWSLETTYPKQEQPGHRYPEIKLLSGAAADVGDGRVAIRGVARWLSGAGEQDWRAYHLVARLNHDSEAPPWVSEWSTDDDKASANGGKTLDLKLALLGIWRNDMLKNQSVAEAYLRIGPQ